MSEEISQIRKKLREHEKRISRLEELFQTKPESIKKKLSIREFMLSKNPKTKAEKTLAIAYYLEKYDGLTSSDAKDLESGFRQTKEKPPRNVNYEVIRNIQKGYMMEAEETKDDRKA